MAAANYDIQVDQGSTFIFNVSYLNSSESVVDLSDYSASMQVRKSIFTDKILVSATGNTSGGSIIGGGSTGYFITGTGSNTEGIGGVYLNASTGGVTGSGSNTGGIYINIDATTMKNIPSGSHFYDLELTSGLEVTRILEGRFEVGSEITR
tara:strand:+ start:1463 stop:1915 length:453 start_codon:yes stop_codon:yes gene_type:complete